MGRMRKTSRVIAVAIAPALLVGHTATAAPHPAPAGGTAAFSLSGIDQQRFADVTGVAAATPQGRAMKTHGFSVLRAASGQTAVVDTSMADQGITTAAAPDFVDVSWKPYADDARYTVSRDGRTVATTAPGAGAFRDTALTPGATYRYDVAPVLPDGATAPGARMWSMQVTVPAVGKGESAVSAMRAQATARATAAAAAKTTTVSWVAFIPQKRIDAPSAGCDYGKGYQFAGDGRSNFDWKSSKYRTAVHGTVDWSRKSVTGNKSIHATHVYNKKTGKLVATKTASGKNTYAKKMGSGSNYVDVRMVTHASNPFCKFGAIDGAFSMHLTTSGNYSIFSGKHRLMPNHHVYIYNGGKVTNVYTRKYANALCLVGPVLCQEATFYGSGKF